MCVCVCVCVCADEYGGVGEWNLALPFTFGKALRARTVYLAVRLATSSTSSLIALTDNVATQETTAGN